MRTFERELLVLAVLGAALLLRRPRPWAGWVFGVASLAGLAAQVWVEGARFQVAPLYLALLLGTWQLTRAGGQRGRVLWALALAGLALMSLLLCWILPSFQLPVPTGSYAVGTRTFSLTDAARGADGVAGSPGQRVMVVQLWYPAEVRSSLRSGLRRARYVRAAEVKPLLRYESQIRTNSWQDAPMVAGDATFPVILYGPMWGGRRTLDTFLMEELASHGYVVAAVDHPGNAARVEMPDGRLMAGVKAGALSTGAGSSVDGVRAAWAAELAIWTEDNEMVLNALSGVTASWAGGRLDMSRVGALGHSFGGAASLRLLGLDPRVRSAVNLDGWTFGGLADRTGQPVMILYEGSGEAVPAGDSVDDRLERADQAIVNGSLARYGGVIGYVQGTQHLDFTDQTLISPVQRLTYTGPIRGDRVRAITRGLVVGFFDRTLKGVGDLPKFAEVKMVRR